MQCLEFHNVAGEWLEGQHTADAATHLASCAACRGLLADLEAIRSAGVQFAADTDIEPPVRVWNSLRAQLEAEGLIRETVSRNWLAALWSGTPRLALAGAYSVLLIALSVFIGTRQQNPPDLAENSSAQLAGTEAAHLQAPGLTQRAVSSMHEHNPEVTAHYQRSLAIVDNSIRMCEKTLREQPQNDLAREYLLAAYQQKSELLSAMAERVATGD
ncbi:MAG: hypothetical protein HY046_01060 [Acidobacteria bacterium]|nr:hypothetical protein [Acidobacteriota bacterium]